MNHQVQDLIEKIKKEGIEEAEVRASEIEQKARKNSEVIIGQAKKQAEDIIAAAKEEAVKQREAGQVALKQAARDTLLNLRKNIEATLQKLINNEVAAALSSEELIKLIEESIRLYLDHHPETTTATVTLSPDRLMRLREGLLSRLGQRLKEGLVLKSSDQVGAGFLISFNKGKSAFDFTESGLAEYLASFVNPEVARIIKGSS